MLKPKKEKKDFFSLKINLVKAGFLAVIFLLIFRLYNIQIIRGEYYLELSLKQGIANIPKAERGLIYFENKNGGLFPAAVNKNGFSLAINPSLIENPQKIYEELSKILPIDKEVFFRKASKSSDPFEILFPRIEKETADKIKAVQKELKGVILVPEKWRSYPAKNLASHILGFVGYDDYKLKGIYGVEEYYNEQLEGQNYYNKNKMFSSLLNFGERIFANYEKKAPSIVLTIEPMVQSMLESNLEKLMDNYNGLLSGGIIINPKNGKILAMAAKPDFDPNNYKSEEDMSVFKNPLVSNIYEMGSIFKPLTMAAALDQSALSPETKYIDNGFIILNGRKIENYDGKARGEVNMQIVLNKSLNTGAVFAMNALGKEKFRNYLINYGLNSKTEIDLPNEVIGQMDNLNSMRDIEFATASFGQGVAVSPIEFAVAASSLANGGNLIKPYIVDRIILNDNVDDEYNDKNCEETKKCVIKNIQWTEAKIKGQPLKKETSEKISRMLSIVVDNALLDGKVKMEHLSIAAKTGTAQIIKGNTAGYSENYLHTFFGYAPAFDPQFLVVLFIERPIGARYASQTLTPVFMEIAKFIINYYEIPPDR